MRTISPPIAPAPPSCSICGDQRGSPQWAPDVDRAAGVGMRHRGRSDDPPRTHPRAGGL